MNLYLNYSDKNSPNGKIDPQLVDRLKIMLDEVNPLVQSFRMVRDIHKQDNMVDVKLKLISSRAKDGRNYNMPTCSEVAALIVGDIDSSGRDIIIESKSGQVQRISELHPLYLALQYPLIFPYAEDGYRVDVSHRESIAILAKKKSRVTMREFFSFRLQDRINEFSILMNSRRLLQQFIVDAYTMIESERLGYIRNNQKNLRIDMYSGFSDALVHGETNAASIGRRIYLPSSFTGGARYMMENYHDAMAICRWSGYPDIFLTFTCNPNWPEIRRFIDPLGLKPSDRVDLICRVFKIKLWYMMQDIQKGSFFGKVRASKQTSFLLFMIYVF